MLTPRRLATGFGLAFALAYAGTAAAYYTRFVADNCNYAAPTPTSYITRDGSAAVALRARHEGYQWAAWMLERQRPRRLAGRPARGSVHRRRGRSDCSGFTFKVWREALDTSDATFLQWGLLRFVHGPYTASAFKAGAGARNVTVRSRAS